MENIKYPKVLIISHNALSLHFNNGKTLYSLFKDFPNYNVAQLFFQDEIPESDKFSTYFKLTDVDVIKNVFKLNDRDICGNEQKIKLGEHFNYEMSKYKKIIINILRNNLFLLVLLRNLIYKLPYWNSKNLNIWIKNFSPDAIFFLGGNYKFSFNIANKLAKKYNIPLYIYITDDYIFNKKKHAFFTNFQQKMLIKTYKKAFNYAKYVFVIGDQMAKDFSNFFNKKFIPIMNLIEIEKYDSIKCDSIKCDSINNTDIITIVFIGGLHLNRWKQIVNLSNILNKIIEETSINVNVEIYSITPPEDDILQQLNKKPLFYKGKLFGDEVIRKMKSADLLLHVESDEEKYRQLTRLSVSTKISEYCACKKCIIAYGPNEVASIRLIEDNNLGITITDSFTEEENFNKLKNLLINKELRDKIGLNAYNFALNNFEAKSTRKKFLEYLIQKNENNNSVM